MRRLQCTPLSASLPGAGSHKLVPLEVLGLVPLTERPGVGGGLRLSSGTVQLVLRRKSRTAPSREQ